MDYSVKQLLSPYIYADIESIYNTQDFQCFKNKTLLITGAGQLVGYYLACSLLIGNDVDSNNTKLILCDRDRSLFEKYGNLNSRTDIDFLVSNTYSNLPKIQADFVIHTDTDSGIDYFDAMENLMSFCVGCNSTAVFASNSNIFASVFNGKSKLSENDMGYVDLSKADNYKVQCGRMVETYGKKLVEETNLNLKFLRIPSVLGALNINRNPLNQFIASSIEKKGADREAFIQNINQDTNAIKSYCYVTDVASALITVLVKGEKGQCYNLSANCDTSIKYITETCEKLFPDLSLSLSYKDNISNDYSISPLKETREILDNSKLLELGFTPKVSLAESIKRTVNIIRENL